MHSKEFCSGFSEVNTERLLEIPKGVSAAHIYKLLEKLETEKKTEEQALEWFIQNKPTTEAPIDHASYCQFLASTLNLDSPPAPKWSAFSIVFGSSIFDNFKITVLIIIPFSSVFIKYI